MKLNVLKYFCKPVGISEEKKARRRKKTNSCSRSRHSSYHSNPDEDNGKINKGIIDIHQLENEAFLDRNEISDSFSIEFASSSNKELTVPKNGFYRNALEESSSHGIIFRHSDSGLSQKKVCVMIRITVYNRVLFIDKL